jgi:hypothetical protein
VITYEISLSPDLAEEMAEEGEGDLDGISFPSVPKIHSKFLDLVSVHTHRGCNAAAPIPGTCTSGRR